MKKNKKIKYETEEQKEVKRFIYVLLGLILVVVGIYFFTRIFITKDLLNNKTNEVTYTEGTINYDVAIVGNMLNRPYEEYYLIAFDSEGTKVNYYNTLASMYMSVEKSLKLYHIDLANELNKKYVATDENISEKFESIDKLKLGEVTLIKVKNKKVTKFITSIENIEKELAVKS